MSELAASGGIGLGAGLAPVLSDERLVRRAAKGDERAFAAIFKRYHQKLYRYCLAIVGDPQDAQDALQNTMVKALRALPGEERSIDLKPWLYRVAHNEAIDLMRRRRETRPLDPEVAATGLGLADEAAVRQRLRGLISDLDELPERQRGVLLMRELAGLEFAEIGSALGTSGAVARQTLYEARLSLRQMDEGREMSCQAVTKALSDGDGRVARRRDVRAHLRACPDCRRFGEEIERRQRDFAALSPLPAVAAAGLFKGLLGGAGGGSGGGGGLAAALGGGAAKTAGASTALKGIAAVAAVATIGAVSADRSGLIDAGSSGEGNSPAAISRELAGAGPAQAEAAEATGAKGPAVGGADSRGPAPADGSSAAAAGPKIGGAGAETTSAPGEGGPGAANAHGQGKAKGLPASSAHGQQTAGSHKAAHHGSPAHSQQAHPAHPSHPAKPSHPVQPSHPASPAPQPHPSAPAQSAPASGGSEKESETTPPAAAEERSDGVPHEHSAIEAATP